jgi:hypothetical protein
MHILDRYALSCGVKIDKPFINPHYYPMVLDKYIVFQTSGKGNSRQYDYWHKAFSFVKEYTTDYKIVHVGIPSDHSVFGVDLDLRGKTSINQLAYVIKNSAIYVGVDSLSVHLASAAGKKIVSLYSYCYAQNCGPVWGDKKDHSLIEVDWQKYGKPSFSTNEEDKKINKINPETIAKAVLDQLQIPNDLDKVETVHIGQSFRNPTIEFIPDDGQIPTIVKDKICNVRLDYVFNEKRLIQLAAVSFLNIISDKPLDLNILNIIRPKISGITLIVDESFSLDYLKDLKSLGIKLNLTALNNENWGRLAEKFFDFNLDKEQVLTKQSVKGTDKLNDQWIFSSEKIIISEGKIFSSKASWKNKQPKLDRYSKVIDSPDFWEEADHFHILKDERPNWNSTKNSLSP